MSVSKYTHSHTYLGTSDVFLRSHNLYCVSYHNQIHLSQTVR